MGIRSYFWKVKDFLQSTTKKPISVIASRDGQLYEVRDHLIGRLVVPAIHIQELDEVQEGFQFALQKLPGHFLTQIVAFFGYYATYSLEALVKIYVDKETNEYILHCPKQEVSPFRVVSLDTNIPLNWIEVAHIHSHHNLNTYFSAQDDRDEQAFLIYGVIGNFNTQPTIKLRTGCNGQFVALKLDEIFEIPPKFSSTDSFPQEWLENVTVIKEEVR